MSLSDDIIKTLSKECIVESINSYCSIERPYKFHPLNLIVPKLRNIRSVIGGLETSFGTKLWEKLAKILAEDNGFTICDQQLLEPVISNEVSSEKDKILSHRISQDNVYDAISSKKAIKELCKKYIDNPITDWQDPPKGHGIDLWFKKGSKNYLFDTKTAQPNVGALIGYLRQIHNWYYYFYSKYPNENLSAKIAFPINPFHPQTFFSNVAGRGLPLQNPVEAVDADSFWQFLTGNPNAYSLIIESFIESEDESSEVIIQYIDSFD